MARDYKLFKTLEIDGTKMGLDENLGRVHFKQASTAITSANTDTKGATDTITEPGIYIVSGAWTYKQGTTTGTRAVHCILKCKNFGSSTYEEIRSLRLVVPATGTFTLTCANVVAIEPSEVPAEISIFGRSSLTSAASYNDIRASKLINTLSIFG